MTYSDIAINVLTCLTYKGIGKAWVVKNLKQPIPVEMIVSLLDSSIKSTDITQEEFEARKREIIRQIEQHVTSINGVVALGDVNFPQHRGDVKNSLQPVALFYKGDIQLLQYENPNIAVIGVLQPDATTVKQERKVVNSLVAKGATIVSGLAFGCDGVAHEQALQSNGKTVAIIPSPLHNILPKINQTLANDIVLHGGLLVSEYLNDATSKMAFTARYQERDRLQALFSDAIVLASSYAKNDLGNDSGARLAMEYARQFNIPRAVMYDSIQNQHNPKFDLNRQLITEQPNITILNKQNYHDATDYLVSLSSQTLQGDAQEELF